MLYIVPFLIACSPLLMNEGAPWQEVGLVWVSGFVGLYCTSAALEGYMRRNLTVWERILFGVAGALLFFHVGWTKIVGTLLLMLGVGIQYLTGEEGDTPSPLERTEESPAAG